VNIILFVPGLCCCCFALMFQGNENEQTPPSTQ